MNTDSHSMPVCAYIGLGGNLNNPLQHVQTALLELDAIPQTRLLARSSLYRSGAMLSAENPWQQPDYINAVAAVETVLPAPVLLGHLQVIEQRHGRVRSRHWGARTLDLDLLLYGDASIAEPGLTVPHPGLPKRAFVLYPLHEIAPLLEVPGYGSVDSLKNHCPPDTLEKIV